MFGMSQDAGDEVYVIGRKDGVESCKRNHPGDALFVYGVFVGAYSEENVTVGVERTARTYEPISPEELRQLASQQ